MRNIWFYTVEHWNEVQADKYIAGIYDKFRKLRENPKMGKLRQDIAAGYYCFPCQEHLIFYLIEEQSIDIIGIPNQQMDAERCLSG